MKIVFIVHVISILLILQPDASLSCDTANWWTSLDQGGWSTCDNDKTFLKGLWRNHPSGNNGLWLIEEASCCKATDWRYRYQPTSCKWTNWWRTLDRNYVWARCPKGYYMQGIYITNSRGLSHLEEPKCCRPKYHPDWYGDCYDEDVSSSFDNIGWSECSRDGYYMTGIYKGGCEQLYCIEKFECCRM